MPQQRSAQGIEVGANGDLKIYGTQFADASAGHIYIETDSATPEFSISVWGDHYDPTGMRDTSSMPHAASAAPDTRNSSTRTISANRNAQQDNTH